MANGTHWEAPGSTSSCTVPLKIRLIGRPSDADLSRLEDVLTNAVARRLITGWRSLGSLHAVFGRRPPAKGKKKSVPIHRPSRHAKADPRDVAEFELLKLQWIPELVKGKTKWVQKEVLAKAAGPPIRTVEAYLAQRRRTFRDLPAHPDDAYWAFAKESEDELNGNSFLRKVLEYSHEAHELAAQRVFYRWVRKAYRDKLGIKDVPAFIKQTWHTATDLAALVEREGVATYGAKTWGKMKYSIQTYNPRPQKIGVRYRLGTLSEHAKGAAVDIEPEHNPQIVQEDWRWIEEVTGRTVNRSLHQWIAYPKDLWQDIKDLNDAFVKEIAPRVSLEEDRRRRVARLHGRRRAHMPSVLEFVFAGHRKLRNYSRGFFTLDYELIERLHDRNLIWGATFQKAPVDLQHFEWPATDSGDGAKRFHLRALPAAVKSPLHLGTPGLRLDPNFLPGEAPE